MAQNPETVDEESFIILGTSPGSSLDIKCNGVVSDGPLDKAQIEDAMKDLSTEASMAFKAHFKLGDGPSPASLMVASTIVSEDKSTEELQKRFGEILDENVLLKETLKQNNESMKDQFLLIASCQEDMMKTHSLHKEKFDETRELVERLTTRTDITRHTLELLDRVERLVQYNETMKNQLIAYRKEQLHKENCVATRELVGRLTARTDITRQTLALLDRMEALERNDESTIDHLGGGDRLHEENVEETRELVERLRQENKKLKQDIVQLIETSKVTSGINGETGETTKSGPPSAVEFVTCPDDDTINKLTAQLELVEKQRRQVIVDNEKLTWQKESLEHIVDATSKERDDLREKLNIAELELCEKDSHFGAEMKMLKTTIQDLQGRLQSSSSITSLSTEEIRKRDALIQQLEGKLQALQCDYKASQLKVLELENVKLEFMKHKSGTSEVVKIYKDQIQDLHNRLKDAQITLFQPVRLSLSPDAETTSSEFSGYLANVKLYDRALKHLAELLNSLAHGTSDNLVQTLGVVASLHDFKLDRTNVEQVRSGLADVKQQLEKQYSNALNNIGQIRSTLTIFEGIFKDYNELQKKTVNMQSKPANGANVEALTSALLARGQEVSALTLELKQLKDQKEEVDVLKAQLELYKSDFEAERTAREMMAVEKEHILTDLRTCQRRNQELTQQIQQSPQRPGNSTTSPQTSAARAPAPRAALARTPAVATTTATTTTGNMVYKCPKCLRFSSEQYKAMEDHFDFCLDDF